MVRVGCYAGFKGAERPLRFQLGERWLRVTAILDRWYDLDASYFRVRTEEGGVYVLRHSEPEDAWTLEAYRQGR